ncbi:MAG: phage portal protein [Ruminococcus flavefaciens]|nr:phage portal protein [Ruminococcus flavefaciens]
MGRVLSGRRILITDELTINRGNILAVLDDVSSAHSANSSEISYLWNYYKGKQPILERQKAVRPEICNKIVENRANEIVSFKLGYLCGEPIQYIARGTEAEVADGVAKLNEMMFLENKPSFDRELIEWQLICGTSFRMVLPDDEAEKDEVPFEIYTLDPRNTFVVYSNRVGNKPLMGVTYTVDKKTREKTYCVYTKDEYFEVKARVVIKQEKHFLGMIPIIEYPANIARLGSFEIVLPMLDAINTIASNRIDGVEQVVQAFIKFINCDISKEEYTEFLKLGAIKVKSADGQKADVDMVTTDLNQDQTQTLVDDLYQTVLTICGMPNRNGGSSTSDTGAAVIMRDGWSLAEARAKDSELMFKRSEGLFLRLVLRIIRDMGDVSIALSDIDIKFTRRNYEAIQSKSQVLVSMLQQEKIHPLLAFTHCGMFSDAESAYTMSMKYFEEQEAKKEEQEAKRMEAQQKASGVNPE